ncbi:unnamed protein product [Arabis nemorensis]|uniref:F-box domain-containing protein n=1 Tax=Arabis nemorensis TaxID=586526 RepID=A0A565C5I5_9BRAS|nr:unnamed protein product [Arabis nemorensis]
MTSSSLSSMMSDWSLLPEELLHIISTYLEDCFDLLHARSVCSSWRSTLPFPFSLLRPSYSLPTFAEFPYVSEDLYTLQKIPLFLFRVKTPHGTAAISTSEYFLVGGIGRDKSEDQMDLPSPVECSVKVNIPRTEPTSMNMHNCQILPLGHQYRMIGWEPESWTTKNRGVAFIPLNKEKGVGGEFVVLLNYTRVLLVLRSAEMRWMRVKKVSEASCSDLVAFRGKFYATFLNEDIFVYDPYTLIGTPLKPSHPLRPSNHLVRSGDDDELFLVEHFNPYPEAEVLDFNRFACRVSMLDEEAGNWVEVSDIGDRVLFIGHYDNVSCSAKELPNGCGVSGNSIVFTNMGPVTYAYKYGVDTGREEDELNCWRTLRENRVTILNTSTVVPVGDNRVMRLTSPVLALRVEL